MIQFKWEQKIKAKMIRRFSSSFFTILLSLLTKAALTSAAAAIPPIAKHGCPAMCGNISVPYPFGVGLNCSFDPWFEVFCNETSTPPIILLKRINMEVLDFSYSRDEYLDLRVKSPVISENCLGSRGRESNNSNNRRVNLTGSPFFYSETSNVFIAAGCNNRAFIAGIEPRIVGCESTCIYSGGDTLLFGNSYNNSTTCNDGTCCKTVIPSNLTTFEATFENSTDTVSEEGCKLAFVTDQNLLFFNRTNTSALQNMDYVPALLDWSIPYEPFVEYGLCSLFRNGSSERRYSNNSVRCYCEDGYEGNPYVRDGCQDIDECDNPDRRRCVDAICVNLPGSYTCRGGGKTPYINPGFIVVGFGGLCLVIGGWFLYKYLKRKRKLKRKKKYFKHNGGLLLQQQMYSHEGSLENTKIFTSKELAKATDNFNKNRVLGQGGQGTVYKGMLVDGRIVAVKMSKAMVPENVQEFINEVVILSQINHRNVVKLLGCCLETEVPLLVYEFVPNGTLYQYLHDQSEEFPLSWETRLRIAKESADALSYLHSSASIPIYHRDVKSTNILLDEKFKAKVSDFGTSRTVSVDQTHLTTNVQGTFGYLDPEYFQSSQFTEKSDVYSFGVVLVELLTGEKPILSMERAEESRSLAMHFMVSMEENQVMEIVDARIVKQAKAEELMMVANLAYRCLSLSGKKRPTMREVARQLEKIMPLPKDSNMVDHHYNQEEMEYPNLDLVSPWDSASFSTADSSLFSRNTCSVEMEPLV